MRRGLIRVLFAIAVFGGTAMPAPAHAQCPAPPAPIVNLSLQRFYSDKAGSTVDPAKLDDHKQETAPLTAFLSFVVKEADRAYLQRSEPSQTAACGLAWLRTWAKSGAYLGKMETPQSESQRKWDMTGAALAYLKLKHWASADDRASIEPWLQKLGDAARAHFDDTNEKRNNHWYWLGLGLGAVGVATDSDKHWQQAKSIMQDAARDIGTDGTLPMEMARQARALHYHAFAAMPLVVLAELGAAKGEDFYALNNGALHRLIAKTCDGLKDPALFDTLAGVAQERPVKSHDGWAALYRARFPDRAANLPAQPDKHRWLGGDVMILKRVLTP